MSQKQLRLAVLRAALRCARHRRTPDRAALLVRVDCSETELDAALAALADDGLVRSATDARLTLAGLAVAVAGLPPARVAAAPSRTRTAA
jgi:hypothetical protein